jgi:hypothetical protein
LNADCIQGFQRSRADSNGYTSLHNSAQKYPLNYLL